MASNNSDNGINKPPAFQFYPKDWLSDVDVVCMSMAQKGAYITLICYCWLEHKLYNNDNYIRNLLGNARNWKILWNGIKHKFEAQGEYLVHPRLEKERMKQEEHRRKKSDAGKKGMKKRWDKHQEKDNTVKDSLITKDNSSSSSTYSSSYSSNIDIYSSFDKFWKAYPRKIGKKPAKVAWEKIKPSNGLIEKILSAIENQKQSKAWQQKQFIPHPTSWLNQERWKDEVENTSSYRDTLESM